MSYPSVGPPSTRGPIPFSCSLALDGRSVAHVQAAGELDLVAAPLLEGVLHQAQSHARLIALDAREVFFIDCAGLHALLTVGADAEWGVPRIFVLPSACVRRLLKLALAESEVWAIDLAAGESCPTWLEPLGSTNLASIQSPNQRSNGTQIHVSTHPHSPTQQSTNEHS